MLRTDINFIWRENFWSRERYWLRDALTTKVSARKTKRILFSHDWSEKRVISVKIVHTHTHTLQSGAGSRFYTWHSMTLKPTNNRKPSDNDTREKMLLTNIIIIIIISEKLYGLHICFKKRKKKKNCS